MYKKIKILIIIREYNYYLIITVTFNYFMLHEQTIKE